MITERKFAITYTSLWREITPSADNFVRHINLAAERFVAPYESASLPILNGAINETAFRLCKEAWRRPGRVFKVNPAQGEKIWAEACLWLAENPVGRFKFTKRVWQDVFNIANNIYYFLSKYSSIGLKFEPEFAGCGVISKCLGDVLCGDTLVEVKAGDRGFRATDLRQIFVYCALARSAGTLGIQNICLMNPRWGVSWSASLDYAATSCGATSSGELLDDIVRGAVLLGVSN